eukprot:Opistho-2@93647
MSQVAVNVDSTPNMQRRASRSVTGLRRISSLILGQPLEDETFGITSEDLGKIVSFDNRDKPEQLAVLREAGDVEGIARSLKCNLETGIPPPAAENNYAKRQEWYGRNVVPPPPSVSLFSLIVDAFQDRILQILLVGAAVTLTFGLIDDPKSGWTEGIAIFMAIIIVVGVTSGNDYHKDRKFKKILLLQSDKKVKVIRAGAQDQISSWDVQCGDLVELAMGDEVPADGIFVHGLNLTIDESPLTGETVPVKKRREAPFLFSGCQVSDGNGTYIATGVGPLSSGGQIQKMLNEQQSQTTPLQEKLEVFAVQIGYVGLAAGVITFLGLTVRWIISISDETWKWKKLEDLIEFFVIGVTIVVVAVPEGLPLAVTISLAFSMYKMIRDQNFVRHLIASETMGEATCICSDKTGTLTENRMTVTECVVGGQVYQDTFTADTFPTRKLLDLVAECAAINSTCFVKYKEKDPLPVFVGSSTEGALLVWAHKMGKPYEDIRKHVRKIDEATLAFSSDRKRMSSTCVPADSLAPYRMYTKGASEIVLALCKHAITKDGHTEVLGDKTRKWILDHVQRMASDGLRTLVLAYRNFDDIPAIEQDPEEDLTFIGLVGIKDPVRKEVPDAVRQCQAAGLKVRMVTGDNILTAKKISQECGILTPGGVAIEGPVFRALSDKEKTELIPHIQVLARSSPADKFELVRRLKDLGEVVAVTGDGTNDAPALKEADVGFAMGQSGTSIAMNASDIVLLDDNFSSIVKAIRWGRNVFDCIRKFLQFQLSVNMVAILITFIGSISTGVSPLSAVQLLWVNLIMDTLGALALATDDPVEDILLRKPHQRSESLITRNMRHYIYVQVFAQTTILLLVLFVAYPILNIPSSDIKKRDTLVFTTFVFMQIWNEIMARQLTHAIWVFDGLFRNRLFVSILIAICAIQALVVQFGGGFTQTSVLNGY